MQRERKTRLWGWTRACHLCIHLGRTQVRDGCVVSPPCFWATTPAYRTPSEFVMQHWMGQPDVQVGATRALVLLHGWGSMLQRGGGLSRARAEKHLWGKSPSIVSCSF